MKNHFQEIFFIITFNYVENFFMLKIRAMYLFIFFNLLKKQSHNSEFLLYILTSFNYKKEKIYIFEKFY